MTTIVPVPSGTWVQIVDLQKDRKLNGAVGKVKGEKLLDSGRIPVEVHDRLYMKTSDYTSNYAQHNLFGMVKGMKCKRNYMATPMNGKLLLLKPGNIKAIPDSEMTALVRVSCRGEIQEGKDEFETVCFPRQHPLFKQKPNCPIPARVGRPLIMTKIEFFQGEDGKPLKNYRHERGWMANQLCAFLRASTKDGFVTHDFDFSDEDFIGPAYVCPPGVDSEWKPRDAAQMYAYLQHLMENVFGEDYDEREGKINPSDFATFVASIRPGKEGFQQSKLFKAAYSGNAQEFWHSLMSSDDGDAVDLVSPNKFDVTLLQAALYGGSGEIIGALLFHPRYELLSDSCLLKWREQASDGSKKKKEVLQFGFQNPNMDEETAKWNLGLVVLYVDSKYTYKGDPPVELVVQNSAMCLPSPGDFVVSTEIDISMLGTLKERYPFPRSGLEAYLQGQEHIQSDVQPFIGDEKYFPGLRCDADLVEKLLYLSIAKERAQLRSLGWVFFLCGGKQAMLIYFSVYRHLVGKMMSRYFDSGMEMAELDRYVQISWDRVGTWID